MSSLIIEIGIEPLGPSPSCTIDLITKQLNWHIYRFNSNKDIPLGRGNFNIRTDDGKLYEFKDSEIRRDGESYYVQIGYVISVTEVAIDS